MRFRVLAGLALAGTLGLIRAGNAIDLPPRWIHGQADEPALQVHEAASGLWILRQSKRSNFEAPFLYLIAGRERALLLDTGAAPVDGSVLLLRRTVDELLDDWAKRRGMTHLPLVVAHTHSHRDHIAGDTQFEDRRETHIVGTSASAVAAFFQLERWPDGEATLDLGRRALSILPLPGHESAHIAVYDPRSKTLFSGDTLYPGLLTIRDWPAYRASATRLERFAARHPIAQVLGAHIEMSSTPRQMYPLETAFQPDEHALALGRRHIAELAAGVEGLGDFRHEDAHPDFALVRVLPKSNDVPGTHGMLMIGTDAVYVSHLPMFHSPHDYQLIAEVALPETSLAAYRADVRAHPGEIYTLAPTERWILPDTIAEGAVFDADLYRGHFERGGEPILSHVAVSIRHVAHFRRFEPGRRPDPTSWIGFGRGSEHFLAHRIEGAPDRDQIAEVSQRVDEGAAVRFDGASPIKVGLGTPAGVVRRVIYTELDDLAEP
jgi:glyoxylase-like metal-dependent hydrolase (beta-lactamase superfamily II)